MHEAERTVREWDERATRRETPCGDGMMTWRVWGEGAPALLIHGNGGSWSHWIRNLETLSRHRTLYVPDLPGHGDSALPPLPPTMDTMAQLLWQGVDALLPSGRPIDVLGFSLGSVLAETMALQRPQQVAELVLLRGSFSPTFPKLPDNVKRWRGLDDPLELARAQRHNLSVLMFHDAGKIDDLAIHTHTVNLQRAVLDTRPLLASRAPDAFGKVSARIHGVSGEFDVYGGADIAEQGRVLRQVHPDARFHLVPRTGHWAIYEAADEVNAILVDVLR